ncbi:hypothetical protein ACFYT4_35660 [Streptomyces sp. NPDC004609]|uniref:hypothetical protein n=1 Tax=Streptomyces sp. NPDC004609 TaxID=3364704 RepID=UPI0036CEA225
MDPVSWREAASRIREAAGILGDAGDDTGAGDVAALADLLTVAAMTAPAAVREEVRAAADAFEQAGRAPGARALEGRARALYRQSAHALHHTPPQSAATVLGLLLALATAVDAAIRWHEARRLRLHARSAAAAGALLREAARLAGSATPSGSGARMARAPARSPAASIPPVPGAACGRPDPAPAPDHADCPCPYLRSCGTTHPEGAP